MHKTEVLEKIKEQLDRTFKGDIGFKHVDISLITNENVNSSFYFEEESK